jgi:hypothetical protein
MEKDTQKDPNTENLLDDFAKLKIKEGEDIVVTHSLIGSYTWRNEKNI